MHSCCGPNVYQTVCRWGGGGYLDGMGKERFLSVVRDGRRIFVCGGQEPSSTPCPKSKTRRIWPTIFFNKARIIKMKKIKKKTFCQSQRAHARPERAHPRPESDHPRPERVFPGLTGPITGLRRPISGLKRTIQSLRVYLRHDRPLSDLKLSFASLRSRAAESESRPELESIGVDRFSWSRSRSWSR